MARSSHDSQNRHQKLRQHQTYKGSLINWATSVLEPNGQRPAQHHLLLLRQLEAISRGEADRLMVLMPPGSAKSTYGSILFPAWWFTQHPNSSVIVTSHTASLAEHFGRQVRDLIIEHNSQLGYDLTAGSRAAGQWRTTDKGEYLAMGVRGPLVGRRADLIIIDDPIKCRAEVDSLVFRERLWGWYRSELLTRLKPTGRVVLIMTRWHEDDLPGRLLAKHDNEWRVIRLPALAENDDAMGRAQDAPLWPNWENAALLLRKRTTVGEPTWTAMFQQSPRPIQGSLFKTTRIETLETPPTPLIGPIVRAWDLAATAVTGANDPDWTVGIKLARDESCRYAVLNVIRLRGSPREVENAIVETARVDGTSVIIGLPEDPGQAGKTQISYLSSRLAGHHISTSRETGAKMTRAGPLASQVEAGNVTLVRGQWNRALIEELNDFPFGHKDDQVDALSRAFGMITGASEPARRMSVPYLIR